MKPLSSRSAPSLEIDVLRLEQMRGLVGIWIELEFKSSIVILDFFIKADIK